LAITTSFRHVSYPVRIHAGDNAVARLGEEVDRAGGKRVLVVCGQTVARRTNLLDRIKEVLGDRFADVFDGAKAGSPLPAVELGVTVARDAGRILLLRWAAVAWW